MERWVTTLIGLGVGVAAARLLRDVPARVFPYPEAEARLRVAGAAPGTLGGDGGGGLFFGTAERCNAGLVNVTRQGAFSSTICTTPEQAAAFTRATNTARTLQMASVAALITTAAAVGYAVGDRAQTETTTTARRT